MLTEIERTSTGRVELTAVRHNAYLRLRYIIYICDHAQLSESYLAELSSLHTDAIHLIIKMAQADRHADTFRELDRLRLSVHPRITFHLADLSCEQKAVLHLLGKLGHYVEKRSASHHLPNWAPLWNLVQFTMPRMSIDPPCLFVVPRGEDLLFVRRHDYFVVINARSGSAASPISRHRNQAIESDAKEMRFS